MKKRMFSLLLCLLCVFITTSVSAFAEDNVSPSQSDEKVITSLEECQQVIDSVNSEYGITITIVNADAVKENVIDAGKTAEQYHDEIVASYQQALQAENCPYEEDRLVENLDELQAVFSQINQETGTNYAVYENSENFQCNAYAAILETPMTMGEWKNFLTTCPDILSTFTSAEESQPGKLPRIDLDDYHQNLKMWLSLFACCSFCENVNTQGTHLCV